MSIDLTNGKLGKRVNGSQVQTMADRYQEAHPLKNTTVALPVVAKNETTVAAEQTYSVPIPNRDNEFKPSFKADEIKFNHTIQASEITANNTVQGVPLDQNATTQGKTIIAEQSDSATA